MPRSRTKTSSTIYNPDLAGLEPRERLVLCARDLFQQKSFDGVNIREIMEAADVTQPTIYYYFQNKDGLFLAALLDVLQEINEDFNEAIRERYFVTQLQALAQAFTRYPAPNLPHLFHELKQRVDLNNKFADQGIPMQDARPAYLYVNQIWPRALENMLREARRSAQIQAANPVFVAHYLLTMLTAYPHSPFNSLTASSPELSHKTMVEFLLNSLKTVNVSSQI